MCGFEASSFYHRFFIRFDCPQDHMQFKTISIPIMGMEGAEESWKTKFHTYNSKTGCLIGAATKSERMPASTARV